MPIIDMKATGVNIKTMIKQNGFKIADVQARCGFNTPQAIFKWQRGETMPTLDNIVVLSELFNTTIEEIVVVER